MDEENNCLTVQDPVCGMRIEPEYAADLDIYKGKIFYFCAPCCKNEFSTNPEQYYQSMLMKENKNERLSQ